MRNKKKPIILLLIILGASIVTYTYLRKGPANDQDTIRLSGNIEVTEAELSFMVAGRVEERPVSEGETIKAGQVVAWLVSTEYAQEVALRKADVQAAQAALAELVAGSRQQRAIEILSRIIFLSVFGLRI